MEDIHTQPGLIIKTLEFQADGYGTQLNGVDHIHFLHVIITLQVDSNHAEPQNQLLNVKKNVSVNIK
jgi:hypothetical protein